MNGFVRFDPNEPKILQVHCGAKVQSVAAARADRICSLYTIAMWLRSLAIGNYNTYMCMDKVGKIGRTCRLKGWPHRSDMFAEQIGLTKYVA